MAYSMSRTPDVQGCFQQPTQYLSGRREEERRARFDVLLAPAPFDERVYIVAPWGLYRKMPPIALLPHIGVHRFRIGGLHVSEAKAGGLDHGGRPR
jgi:hypothetical protein